MLISVSCQEQEAVVTVKATTEADVFRIYASEMPELSLKPVDDVVMDRWAITRWAESGQTLRLAAQPQKAKKPQTQWAYGFSDFYWRSGRQFYYTANVVQRYSKMIQNLVLVRLPEIFVVQGCPAAANTV